jgi:prevent-host-death family protein
MRTINATSARKEIYSLIDETNDSHTPIQITGKRGHAVLIGEEDYRAMQETLFLLSIPNMRESLINGKNTKLDDCEDEESLDW